MEYWADHHWEVPEIGFPPGSPTIEIEDNLIIESQYTIIQASSVFIVIQVIHIVV